MDFKKAYDLIVNELTNWLNDFIRLLPNLVIAVVVLVLGFFIAKKSSRLASKVFKKVVNQQVLNALFASFVQLMIIGISIFAALSILNLDKALTSLLAGAGIIGLALAFAFQDIAANFVSGIVMSFTRPMEIGDIVKVNDYMGKVESIRLRDSVIRTFGGQKVFIPNKEIFQNPIENFSKYRKRRLDLVVGVSYGDDLEKVKELSLKAVESVDERTNDPIELFFEEFADSSINFSMRIWLKSVEQPVYLEARSQAIMKLKAVYDANDITIPFPIRTLDFGIKGGERLFDAAVMVNQNGKS